MSLNSKIEWTESSWNPVTGCDKVSQGCANCYACTMAKRLKAMGNPRYSNGFELTLHYDLLDRPKKWRRPRLIFVNSMSDLFHEGVPDEFIERVFFTMNKTPRHIYQILTKRTHRLRSLASRLTWTKNIWQGVSIEDRQEIGRLNALRGVPARTRFLSLEPLLERLDPVELNGIHWVIVGGESGPKARPMQADWVRGLRDTCVEQRVPFFFKQWGGVRKRENGRKLDGQLWDQWPNQTSDLFYRQGTDSID